jgi:hypothetical protein
MYYSFGDQSGVYAVDSVVRDSYGFTLRNQRLRLSVDLLWITDQSKSLRFYAGFGLGGGVSLNATIDVGYEQGYYHGINLNSYNVSPISFLPSGRIQSASDKYYSAPIYEFAFSIPMGMEFQLAKKGLFSYTNLF